MAVWREEEEGSRGVGCLGRRGMVGVGGEEGAVDVRVGVVPGRRLPWGMALRRRRAEAGQAGAG